jgi:biotin carboxylase
VPVTVNGAQKAPCLTFDVLFLPISIVPLQSTSEQWTEKDIQHSIFRVNSSVPKHDDLLWAGPRDGQNQATLFIHDAIEKNINQYGRSITAIKLLLPAVDGYVVRNDIIQRRFLNSDIVDHIADFTVLRQHIKAFETTEEGLFKRALRDALGAVSIKEFPGSNRPLVESAMALLESEVIGRLSFPWIIDSPLPKKRLALVEGRAHPDVLASAEGPLRAAGALGIDLVIVDNEGHWLQDPAQGHLRDEFLACDLNVDDDLPNRIVEAVKKSKAPIDGIITYHDKYLSSTARAAKLLGLWNVSPEILDLCTDKQKTRQATSPEFPVISTSGLDDLKEQLAHLPFPLQYPLIVKPAKGSFSDGVSKVSSEAALFHIVQRNQEKFPGKLILVEPYISGPEVDANFVLFDGKVLFSEINDDFPSSADIPDLSRVPSDSPSGSASPTSLTSSASSSSFAETSTIMPSILPDAEIDLLKSSLSETLLKLGFRNGVFHVEARVKDSRKRYEAKDNGLELVDCGPIEGDVQKPSVFLIEINVRTPGHQEAYAVEYTYGVDYYALYTLLALFPESFESAEDHLQRASRTGFKVETAILDALSQPFPAHIQRPSHLVFIPVTRGGTFMSAKPLPPSLMEYIPHHRVLMKNGDVIQDPEVEGRWPFIAYFMVMGKMDGIEGREQVRTLGETVRDIFEYEVV